MNKDNNDLSFSMQVENRIAFTDSFYDFFERGHNKGEGCNRRKNLYRLLYLYFIVSQLDVPLAATSIDGMNIDVNK